MKAEQVELKHGFIGISRGDRTINAVIWRGGDNFYFLVVGNHFASRLEEWDEGTRTWKGLMEIAYGENITQADIELLYDGTIFE